MCSIVKAKISINDIEKPDFVSLAQYNFGDDLISPIALTETGFW